MKKTKLIFFVVFVISVLFVLSSCTINMNISNKEQSDDKAAIPDEIHVDSPIVGQWVPIGVEDANGYLQFSSDGSMMRFSIDENGEMKIEQQRYYLSAENKFIMIHPKNTLSDEYEFEVVNDGQTLNIYDPVYHMASEFLRIAD